METTRLSSGGQVIIPKALRDSQHWESGQELIAIETDEGILLKAKKPFPETQLEDVAGCLKHAGTVTLTEMEAAIQLGVEASWHDHD